MIKNPEKSLLRKRFCRLVVISIKDKNNYKCLCDCGNKISIPRNRLITGNTRSCGCIRKEQLSLLGKAATLPFGQAAFNSLIYQYKKRSEKKKIKFSLSNEDFKVLTKQNCYYCDQKPNNICGIASDGRRPMNGFYQYNGLDRIDNSKGYSKDNCVPCCKQCNISKNNLEQTQFKDLVIKIFNHWANK